MSIFRNHLPIMGASGAQATGYTIDQSIRFDVGASPEMSRTHGTGGNTDLSTVSFWFKRGRMTTQVVNDEMHIFGAGSSTSSTFDIQFTKTDQIHVWDYQSAYVTRLKTNRVFRDPSAWYHLVFVYDSGNGIASDRARLYINGIRETSFAEETYPSQNQNAILGTNVTTGFGNYISYGSKYYCGYLAEAHYINGYGYGPEYFGEFKENTDIWIPKEFEGNYGSKGFFVDGRDSGDLGDDESGNGNDLSTSGLAAHDQMLDSPTNNFPVINHLDWVIRNAAESVPLSEGNLKFTGSNSTGVYGTYNASIRVPDYGGWYFEMVVSAIGSSEKQSQYVYVGNLGFLGTGNSNLGSYGSAWSAGDIIGVAVNTSGIWFSINGTYQNSGNPATGSNSVGTPSLPGMILLGDGSATNNSSSTGIFNFGQDGTFAGTKTAQGNTDANGIGNFYYSPPSGFVALCTSNLGS